MIQSALNNSPHPVPLTTASSLDNTPFKNDTPSSSRYFLDPSSLITILHLSTTSFHKDSTRFDDNNNHSRDAHIRTTNPAAYYTHAAHITTDVPTLSTTHLHFPTLGPTHTHFPILGPTYIYFPILGPTYNHFPILGPAHITTHFPAIISTHIRTYVLSHVTASDHTNTRSYSDDTIAIPDNFVPDQRDFEYLASSYPHHSHSKRFVIGGPTPSSVAVPPSTSTTSGPGGGPGTGPGSGLGEGGDGPSAGHGLSRQSKLVIIIICGTLGLMALICVTSYLVHRQRQKRLRRVGRGGISDVFLANDGFIKLSTAMEGGGKRESDLTEHKARAMRESRGPNLIHEELGQGRHRSWHDPQGRASSESKRSVSKAMMSSRRSSMASSRRSSFQNLRRTSCGPQGSSPSMEEDVSFFGAGGLYTPDMLNGPHKVIGGSQASSLSAGGRESRTFLRDSEYYHDDKRSWNTNSSRVSLGGSSTASDAYLLPRDVYNYDEGERIPLEERVAFIKAQQQDMDRQRHEQQLWLDRMEGLLRGRSESGGESLSRTLLESDDPLSKSSTMDGEESKRSSKMHEEEEGEVDEHFDMSDLGTSKPLSLDEESIVSERLTHNISPTTTAFTGELEYL
ncbi:MAG: hypothetical protein BYD32DRAFT_451766 [Podila humilis]|nr:MAG: hypothetical protein BYD32DRAFT_451766 [Podila humilis]